MVCFELDFEFYFLFFLQTAKPPVFGPCRLLDFELEMVGQQESVTFNSPGRVCLGVKYSGIHIMA